MPTPFTHLRLATPLLDPANEWLSPAVAELLQSHPGPFLLGSTAPDVRNISPLSRRQTHFCPVPPDPLRTAEETMLQTWPSLSRPRELPPEQAAFVAGYVAHLWFDEFWHRRIILPYYLSRDRWGTHQHRFRVYHILLGSLDVRDKEELDGAVGAAMQGTEPAGWLPFVFDADLVAWRDFLAGQLLPGGVSRTVAILARRARMDAVEFLELVSSEERMDDEVFVRTPRTAVEQAYVDGAPGSAQVVTRYLQGNLDCAATLGQAARQDPRRETCSGSLAATERPHSA